MSDFTGGVFHLNDNKAGLTELEGGRSKDDVSRILTEASEGSLFYENKKQKHKAIEQRIEAKRILLERTSAEELVEALRKANELLLELESSRDLSRTIVHVDMDMFYAAVEMRDNPELKDKPVAVGSMSMLATSNYVARKFGVRAAQPGFMGKKLCPELIIIPCNFTKYKAVGATVRQVFAEYDPKFSSYSLDEAYLDITDHLSQRQSSPGDIRTIWRCDCQYLLSLNPEMFPRNVEDISVPLEDLCPSCGRPAEKLVLGTDAESAVMELRTKVFQRTSLTCSSGISVNGMLAKICTDKNKPNGQYRLPSDRESVVDFVRDLPVRKIPGIGAATEEMLQAFGVQTCLDLREKRQTLAIVFSDLSLEHFMRVSLGLGTVVFGSDEERKSISTERTFREIWKPADLYRKLEELTEDIVESMQDENICGKCVSIKIKLVNFESCTRAHTIPHPMRRFDEIYPVAKRLLDHEIRQADGKLRLRLMGIRMSHLQTVSSLTDHRQQPTISKFFPVSPTKNLPSERIRLRQRSTENLIAPTANDEVEEISLLKHDETATTSGTVDSSQVSLHVGCPNCTSQIETDPDYVAFNRHLDDCLNRQIICLSEISPSSSTKRLKLADIVVSAKKKPKQPAVRKITDYLQKTSNDL